jgi:hypothetical protein
MHETGVIRKLVHTAMEEAERRGSRLRRIYVRLGALAGGTAAHLREHFVHELQALGLDDIELDITEMPEHPAGVEITGIELAGRAPDPVGDGTLDLGSPRRGGPGEDDA